MLLSDKKILASSEKICEECGKQFTVINADMWAYKLPIKAGRISYFCRYNCCRAGEKKRDEKIKLNRSKGRKIELKANKPKKGVLEKDLMLGLPIAQIAKKYEASSQTIHNWIKSYGLTIGDQGQKKPVDKSVIVPKVLSAKQFLEDIIQESPTLKDIEQFHTDEPIQELPKVEFDQSDNLIIEEQNEDDLRYEALAKEDYELSKETCKKIDDRIDHLVAEHNERIAPIIPESDSPEPMRETFDEIWLDVHADLATLERLYVAQARKSFREKLRGMVVDIMGGEIAK